MNIVFLGGYSHRLDGTNDAQMNLQTASTRGMLSWFSTTSDIYRYRLSYRA